MNAVADEGAGPTTAAPSLPLRVACVDMGSNAIRFLAAEFATPTLLTPLASERRPVRLGHGVYLSGRLNAKAMDAAVAALVDFKRQMVELGIEHHRAVATSAVRESRNGQELVERIAEETGIEVEVISGSEEVHLVHRAVVSRVALGRHHWILTDLGGGSVEVSLVDCDGILWSESHTMGSVRLMEELTESAEDPGRFRRLLEEYITTLRIPSTLDHAAPRGLIATGGNIETLAKLADAGSGKEVSTLPLEVLRALIERLATMSYRQRVDELGLREDRADVILPAAVVYRRLAELAGADSIIVPHVGIKEGILHDLVQRLLQQQEHRDRRSREVQAGAVQLGRKYLFDEAHSVHVSELALSLFDQLQPLHELGVHDRKILQAAALLHDIGQFVSYKGHHKHSLYLISHSELPSFTSRDMQLVANVARYHRKSEPASHHPLFTQLGRGEQERVRRLAAVLRLADSLDREHLQRVERVTVHMLGEEITLTLEGPGDLLLEGWSLKRRVQMFTNVFDKKIRLQRLGEELR